MSEQEGPRTDKRGRVVIRNLVFDVSEKALRKLCGVFGPIEEVGVPLDPATGRSRGFAFVQFGDRGSANRAVAALGKRVFKGRKLSAALAVDQRLYQPQPALPKVPAAQHPPQPAARLQPRKAPDKAADLPRTIFAQGLPFDADEQTIKGHFSRLGRVRWVKLVRPTAEGPHKGCGFVCFDCAEVASRAVAISAQVSLQPERQPLHDPAGVTLLQGRVLLLRSAIKKEELEPKQAPIADGPLSRLAARDPRGNRGLALLLRGLRPAKQTELEAHIAELSAKANNPNLKVSPTRISFSHLSKLVDKEQLRQFVLEVLREALPAGEFARQKKVKQIVLLSEEDGRSKGIAFVEFWAVEVAARFLAKVAEPGRAAALSSGPSLTIEHAFYDARKLSARLKAIEAGQQRKSRMDLPAEAGAPSKKSRETREALKKEVRQKVESALKLKDKKSVQEAQEALSRLPSRGLKQRLQLKLNALQLPRAKIRKSRPSSKLSVSA